MPPSLLALKECLLDISQPISKRTHAAFYCRTIGTAEAASVIATALQIREDTPLMRHELAYILGQMQHQHVCPILTSILEDEQDDVLVRHESAEALGAIGDESSLDVLARFASHLAPEISETCQIAIDLIKWNQQNKESSLDGSAKKLYLSVDPAPAIHGLKSVQDLQDKLMDTSSSLFDRYRAMFSLRDLNTNESALALVIGFSDSSALFRHEIAYVLGQMQRPVTIAGLVEVLRNDQEHRMVRHEAAEALGAIGGPEVELVLNQYKLDDEHVVVQSCEVALDTMEYWNSEFA